MEAKDTVIETPDHSESVYCSHCGEEQGIERMVAIIREAQAEISFKAGQEEERRFILQNTDRDKRARLEGREEVVDWINSNPVSVQSNSLSIKVLLGADSKWQAKLKEWGL